MRFTQVVGGEEAKLANIPYIISLSQQDKGHFCGGALVDARTVVTAAHCVADKNESSIIVRAGSLETSTGGIAVTAAQLILHPDYNPDSFRADIAVVKLSKSIEADNGIEYITLPPFSFELTSGTRVTAAGW